MPRQTVFICRSSLAIIFKQKRLYFSRVTSLCINFVQNQSICQIFKSVCRPDNRHQRMPRFPASGFRFLTFIQASYPQKMTTTLDTKRKHRPPLFLEFSESFSKLTKARLFRMVDLTTETNRLVIMCLGKSFSDGPSLTVYVVFIFFINDQALIG